MDEGRVLRNKESHILLHTQLSYDLVAGTLHDLYHHRLFDMLVTTGHIRHFYTIAIHRRHRVTLCHKHRGTTIVRQERVAPTGLSAEHTLLYLCLLVQTV